MKGERDLAGMFTVLLFGVMWPAGCAELGYGGRCTSLVDRRVGREVLAEVLADGKLSHEDCVALCTEPIMMSDPTTSGGSCTDPGTEPTTGMSTGSTSADTSSSGTETSRSGTETGDGSGAETGDSGTSGACMDVTSVDPEEGLAGTLVTCSELKDAADSVRCEMENCAVGRRPAGLRSGGRALASDVAGLWCAEVAHLEAASVPAFTRLAAALAIHGAPDELCARALAAAEDERRHASQMTALAAEFGAVAATLELDEVAMPTLLELALDNAVQGCVGETWAALLARHQADAAGTTRVRAVMAAIAADETEHAELAWAIDAWLCSRLTADERAEVDAARTAACEALRERAARGVDHPALQDLGVPRRATAVALYDGLSRALWLAA